MNTKKIIIIILKVIALSLILSICFTIASFVSGLAAEPTQAAEPTPDVGREGMLLILVSLLQTSIFTYIILRSRWYGWKLVIAIFLVYFGSIAVSQIESIFYLSQHLPSTLVPKIILMGAIIAGLFSPLSVLILGKMKQSLEIQDLNPRLIMPPREMVWKLIVIVFTYLILYYTFGYFIAWKNPAVQAYYGGSDAGSFFAQMALILSTGPWTIALQAFRVILWIAFTLPVIRMLMGRTFEVAIAIALLFTVWSSMLLLPNPYMPAVVRMIHILETVPENLIFGWLVGWLLSRHHLSLRDLFRFSE